ncbi:MAG: hypothetical protein IPK13_09600 [Deltaproteobacteria bacterium]|nr:hypothetical protein [Deltaproteobacteria bacterium]
MKGIGFDVFQGDSEQVRETSQARNPRLIIATLLLASGAVLPRCHCGDESILVLTPGTCEPDFPCEQGLEYRRGECRTSRCQIDADCCPGQKCNAAAGFCSDQFVACTTDDQCAAVPDQRCIDFRGGTFCGYPNATGTRTAVGTPSCNADTDCDPDRACLGHRCVAAVPCNGGCADGQVCDLDSNTCTRVAACDASCGEGEILVLADPDTMSGPACCLPDCACAVLPPIPAGQYLWYGALGGALDRLWVTGYDPIYEDLVAIEHNLEGQRLRVHIVDGFPTTGPLVGNPEGPRGGRDGLGDRVGEHSAVVVDPASGAVHIAYYDRTQGALKYAQYISGTWHTMPIDGVDGVDGGSSGGGNDPHGDAGLFTSIALDPSGAPRIAYMVIDAAPAYDAPGSTSVRVASAASSQPSESVDWTIETLESRVGTSTRGATAGVDDTIEGIGLFTSIQIKSDGTAMVAYYDAIQGDLRLATETSTGTYRLRTLDGNDPQSPTDAGQHANLAIAPDGHAGVAYFDATRQALLYLDVSTEAREVVDDGLVPPDAARPDLRVPGADASLIFDANSQPLIAYQDPTRLDLMWARRQTANSSPEWTLETLRGAAEGDANGLATGFYTAQFRLGSTAYLSTTDVDFDEEGELRLNLALIERPL